MSERREGERERGEDFLASPFSRVETVERGGVGVWLESDFFTPAIALRSWPSVPSLSVKGQKTSRTRAAAGERGEREGKHAVNGQLLLRAFFVAKPLWRPLAFFFIFGRLVLARCTASRDAKTQSRELMRRVLRAWAIWRTPHRRQELQDARQILQAMGVFFSLSLSLAYQVFFLSVPNTRASERTDARTRLARPMALRCCARVREKQARDRWGAPRRENARVFFSEK